jgi:hypothetical protein
MSPGSFPKGILPPIKDNKNPKKIRMRPRAINVLLFESIIKG